MKLSLRPYIYYKLLNSIFLGVSVGSVFILYTPLEPSVYSIGGIFLAVAMLLIAKLYDVMMNMKVFFYVTLLVEFIVLTFVLLFLIFDYSYITALMIYLGYQVTFMFGNYLVRMETIVLKKRALLSFTDVAKQKGYLVGLVLSYLFYKLLDNLDISDKQIQVYDLHVGLFILQLAIIYFILKAFKRE